MIGTFSKEQIGFVVRLMDATKDRLEKVVRITRPGNMQHDKSSLVRAIIADATQDTTGGSISFIKTVEALRAKLCEERLAEWRWFDMTPPEEREEPK